MPLAHSCPSPVFPRVARAGRLVSQRRLADLGWRALDPACDEVALGTESDVFAFAAPFRYRPTSCGLLFSREIEVHAAERAVATPFDSGGLRHHVRRADPAEPPRDFLRRHELPVPEFRGYLEQTLTCLFASPWDYVDGVEPDAAGPLGLSGGDARRYTFEVRVRDDLPLDERLLAVFMPVEIAAEESVTAALERWQLPAENVRIYVADWAAGVRDEEQAWGGLVAECRDFLAAFLERSDVE